MLSKNKIKYIKSLQLSKFRQKYNQFIVEGVKSSLELLTSNYKIAEMYVLNRHEDIFNNFNCPIYLISENEMKQISALHSHSPVLALVTIPETNILSENNFVNETILCLDEIQDPGNLGTIIRTADWYGIKTIICSTNCVDMYNPKVIMSTMGSFCRVNIIYTSLYTFLENYKFPILGAFMEGDSIYTIQIKSPKAIVIGNEGNGISEDICKLITQKITIPKKGNAESLNAAIATAIFIDRLS